MATAAEFVKVPVLLIVLPSVIVPVLSSLPVNTTSLVL